MLKTQSKAERTAYTIAVLFLFLGCALSVLLWLMHTRPRIVTLSGTEVVNTGYTYGIESVERQKDCIKITGFCSKDSEKIQTIDISCVLFDEITQTAIVLPTKWETRGEVTVEMVENGLDYDRSGFAAKAFDRYLEKGRSYRIGILYRNDGNNAFILTENTIIAGEEAE